MAARRVRARDESGNVAVEFAVLVPILIIVGVVIAAIAGAGHLAIATRAAADDAARAAAACCVNAVDAREVAASVVAGGSAAWACEVPPEDAIADTTGDHFSAADGVVTVTVHCVSDAATIIGLNLPVCSSSTNTATGVAALSVWRAP